MASEAKADEDEEEEFTTENPLSVGAASINLPLLIVTQLSNQSLLISFPVSWPKTMDGFISSSPTLSSSDVYSPYVYYENGWEVNGNNDEPLDEGSTGSSPDTNWIAPSFIHNRSRPSDQKVFHPTPTESIAILVGTSDSEIRLMADERDDLTPISSCGSGKRKGTSTSEVDVYAAVNKVPRETTDGTSSTVEVVPRECEIDDRNLESFFRTFSDQFSDFMAEGTEYKPSTVIGREVDFVRNNCKRRERSHSRQSTEDTAARSRKRKKEDSTSLLKTVLIKNHRKIARLVRRRRTAHRVTARRFKRRFVRVCTETDADSIIDVKDHGGAEQKVITWLPYRGDVTATGSSASSKTCAVSEHNITAEG